MIATARLNRDKALISALYESGARISELLKLRVKDLQETEHGIRTLIPGMKTGEEYRPCLFIHSAQYLRNHILYPPLKQDDLIFDLTKDACLKNVKKIAKEAGIQKRVYNHAFRHAQATLMVRKGYQESVIRQKLGWTGDSKMIARYVSIDGEDVINATLDKEGISQKFISQDLTKPILPAAPIVIADPTLEFNRINQENAELRELIEAGKNTWEDMQVELLDKDRDIQAMEARLKQMELMLHDPNLILAVADGLKAKMGKVK